MSTSIYRLAAAIALIALSACSGEKKESDEHKSGQPAAAARGAPASDVKPTGKSIIVELYSDEKGNYFKPNKFEVHRGDKIVFTLAAGVRNVHFLPDSNPGKANLPPAS